MTDAILWGAIAASSLVIDAVLRLVRAWSDRWVDVVLAFGAGALISAVSFDLAQEGGIGIAAGNGVSVGLLVAIFVSNLPEAIGSATEMRDGGKPPATIRRLWLLVALICATATVIGYVIADNVSGNLNAAVDGFAAGALLVMLIDSMIPDAVRKGGDISGLVTVLGFAVAAGLSGID
ncbi:hypothetical protein [Baekduia sp.]|uniref:ZIP family metal transporter n=1 Tax=Baekduia sp. TaxID=2600305 RepID=UPI002E067847|nr:hypothetical protein [Baekduia sp.]